MEGKPIRGGHLFRKYLGTELCTVHWCVFSSSRFLRAHLFADDILHARIQTMGVAEHIFDVDIHGKTVTWHLFDVGGARGQRHSWVPYFDDANAIIFVSPISAFDQVRASAPAACGVFMYLGASSQYLEEDPRTNRIDDSLQLFTQICSNQLLKRVHLVLFLSGSSHANGPMKCFNTIYPPQTRLIS